MSSCGEKVASKCKNEVFYFWVGATPDFFLFVWCISFMQTDVAAIISEHTNLPKSTTSTTFACILKIFARIHTNFPPSKRDRGIPAFFCRAKRQAVTDIQLAFSSGDRRLGMARMLERLCGALELELRKLTQKVQRVPCVCVWRLQCGTCVILVYLLHWKIHPFFWLNIFNLDSYFQTRGPTCDISFVVFEDSETTHFDESYIVWLSCQCDEPSKCMNS